MSLCFCLQSARVVTASWLPHMVMCRSRVLVVCSQKCWPYAFALGSRGLPTHSPGEETWKIRHVGKEAHALCSNKSPQDDSNALPQTAAMDSLVREDAWET